MKKLLKKLSGIALFSLCVMLSSCDPGFHDTFKVKNGLDRDIKAFNDNTYDTITIKSGKVEIVEENGGIGISQFENQDEYLYSYPIIIFDDSIVYEIGNQWDLARSFKRSIFKKSCWEILEADDKANTYKVLYTITEEDYQNALILNENK